MIQSYALLFYFVPDIHLYMFVEAHVFCFVVKLLMSLILELSAFGNRCI